MCSLSWWGGTGIMNYKELNFIDEKIYETVVNGLKVYYIPKKGFTKSYAILTSDFGSKDVEFSIDGGKNFRKYPEGIAHFLEHKVFEMPGDLNVFNKFTEQGASVNAFTNNHQTSYYFSTTDQFMENLSLLLEMVFTPHLTEENVEKEKGIIAEEIKMYDDHPGFRGYIEALKSMYFTHPVREDIAGTVESIYKLTSQDLIDCYNARTRIMFSG
jgi:predicted Zn-dependent peptidase